MALVAAVVLAAAIGCTDGNKQPATVQPQPAAADDDGVVPATPGDPPATPDEVRDMIGKQVNQPASSGEPQVPVVANGPGKAAPADPRLGKLLTISGTAANAFLGAVVVDGNGDTYYVEGLSEWTDELLDQRVEVTGTLRRKKLAPDPVVGPNGEVSHGMKGMAPVLEAPTFKPVRQP